MLGYANILKMKMLRNFRNLSKSANLVKHNFPGKAKYYLKEFEKLKINTYSRMHDDLTELNIAEMQTLRDYSQEMRKSFSL